MSIFRCIDYVAVPFVPSQGSFKQLPACTAFRVLPRLGKRAGAYPVIANIYDSSGAPVFDFIVNDGSWVILGFRSGVWSLTSAFTWATLNFGSAVPMNYLVQTTDDVRMAMVTEYRPQRGSLFNVSTDTVAGNTTPIWLGTSKNIEVVAVNQSASPATVVVSPLYLDDPAVGPVNALGEGYCTINLAGFGSATRFIGEAVLANSAPTTSEVGVVLSPWLGIGQSTSVVPPPLVRVVGQA